MRGSPMKYACLQARVSNACVFWSAAALSENMLPITISRASASSISIFVEIVLKNHREADFNRFLSAIRGRPEVLECHKVSGKIDYMLRLVCRDVEHYSEISDFLGSDELGVEKAQGHVVLGQEKPFKGYPLDMLMQAN